MITHAQAKILTIITNAKISREKKDILVNYIYTLTDDNIFILIGIFMTYPKAVEIYADYLEKLHQGNEPITKEKTVEILTSLLNSSKEALHK